MEKYNEIISKSLIDFEEIKFILANNNVELVKSYEIKERYFLNKSIKFKSATFERIMKNSYILTSENDDLYLSYKSKEDNSKLISKLKIVDSDSCIEFLNHVGFKETFGIEKNVYVYSDGINKINIINLINIGLYLNVKKEEASINELKDILSSFAIPYNEDNIDESIEKLVINKVRRYLK
jgi:adenylate cyclase class IV